MLQHLLEAWQPHYEVQLFLDEDSEYHHLNRWQPRGENFAFLSFPSSTVSHLHTYKYCNLNLTVSQQLSVFQLIFALLFGKILYKITYNNKKDYYA